MLWPLLLIRLPARWLGRTTIIVLPAIAIATTIAFALFLRPRLAAELDYTLLPTRILPLALGCFLAVIEARGRHLGLRTAAAASVAGACLLLAAVTGRAAAIIPASGWFWAIILPSISLISFGFVTALISPATPAWLLAPFRWSTARFMGRISYAMYLVHIPLLFALGINAAALDEGPAPLRGSALVVLLSFLIATTSLYLIERPLSRLKDRIGNRAPALGDEPSAQLTVS
jgi:peptidoglycan/LPS O-acetylase OafA/YrhL